MWVHWKIVLAFFSTDQAGKEGWATREDACRERVQNVEEQAMLEAGDKEKSFSDKFIESSDAEFLDKFMMKFIA